MLLHHLILSVAETAASEAKPGLLGTLGINWKLFLAQLVNFAIVLFVFWKWIVKPLGSTLMARQEKIEAGLKHAEEQEAGRKNFETWKADEMKKARTEAEHIIKTASSAAEKLKQETMSQASAQSAKLLEQTKAELAMQKETMLKEVRSEVAGLVVAASEKILKEKLSDKKDLDLIKQNLGGIR
ncbi:MAG: F0F1 ATP synthase subunit B [Candidatus Saccharibacteria bacterium]